MQIYFECKADARQLLVSAFLVAEKCSSPDNEGKSEEKMFEEE